MRWTGLLPGPARLGQKAWFLPETRPPAAAGHIPVPESPRPPEIASCHATESTRSLRRRRRAHRGGAHGAGLRRAAGRRQGAAHHPQVLRGAPLSERARPGARRPRPPRLLDSRATAARASMASATASSARSSSAETPASAASSRCSPRFACIRSTPTASEEQKQTVSARHGRAASSSAASASPSRTAAPIRPT